MSASPSLQIKLLGGFDVRTASDACLELPTKKAKCLLAYLAYHRGERQPRDKLLGMLWSESEEKRAQHNLRQSLTYLRKSLEPIEAASLSSDRYAIALAVDGLEVDVARFLDLAASDSPADLGAAVALYKGDLLAGLDLEEPDFQDWLETERRHLREVYGRTMQALIDQEHASGNLEEAVRLAQRLLASDPLQERVQRTLMALYGEMGMREAAIQQFERCRTMLAEELGVEPEPETIALLTSLRGGGNAKRPDLGQLGPLEHAAGKKGPSHALALSGAGNFWGRWKVLASVLGLLVLLALVASIRPWAPDFEPASIERMAYPLPESPSIAVLPFDNGSGDPEQDYLAYGMTDGLITDLSMVPGLFVIYGMSTLVYRGRDIPVRQVAEDLGVRYVLRGSVRRVGDGVRIDAQLIDATSGDLLWTERFDGVMTNVPALEDRVNLCGSARACRISKVCREPLGRRRVIGDTGCARAQLKSATPVLDQVRDRDFDFFAGFAAREIRCPKGHHVRSSPLRPGDPEEKSGRPVCQRSPRGSGVRRRHA